VPFDATTEEIGEALKERMRYWLERQAGADRQLAEDMLNRLRKASTELRDEERRQNYDAQLHDQEKQARTALAGSTVRPLEDFPGRAVTSLKDLVRICEGSPSDWRIGEGLLRSRALLFWARYALADASTVELIERISATPALSDTRKLNRLLYELDPERPFRFYSGPEAVEAARADRSAATVAELVTFADANWDLAVKQLYDGELLVWLDQQVGMTSYEGRLYHTVQEYFDVHCRVFAGSRHAGMGLELLLEFLDPRLPKPAISVTFDEQPNGYSLLGWDGELPHQTVALAIANTTRGYFSGEVVLQAPTARDATTYPWVAFHWLPVASTPRPEDTRTRPGMRDEGAEGFILRGKTNANYRLYLGNFANIRHGKRYKRAVLISRYETTPSATVAVEAYPVELQLMRFVQGYRAKLWQLGLRGSLPGAVLDGGIAALCAFLICTLGFHVVPLTQWGFFPSTQEYTGQFNWTVVIDGALTGLLRPFYLAFSVFGWALVAYLGAAFAACGFLCGLRRGHTQVTEKQDLHSHRVFTRWLVLALLALSGSLAYFTYAATQPPYQAPPSLTLPWQPYPTYLTLFMPYFPPLWNGFMFVASLAPPLFAYIVGRIIIGVRARLYRYVSTRWSVLLTPQGKG
jgi:hypothetical protein